ncbi:MAG: hypothetical protein OXE78_10350 [Gammaproteobacteria bacterium]|nr:hypothetical protein [Gammaproteobacteria bacterium]MCY4356407.1 hypothetical protein [Gammaproteobacteria bacterium]
MRTITRFLFPLLFGLIATVAFNLSAQSVDTGRFLSLTPSGGLPVIPVLEGWIANPDGTTSYSFGVINRNEEAVEIPLGESNRIEPAYYDGIQPTHFPPGRSTGAFLVTVPAAEQDNDVWWYLKTGESEELKVPGRHGVSAYELDFILPRPQGALQPLVGIGEDGEQAAGLYARIGDFPDGEVAVGEMVEITVNATDPAVRDTEDPRFGEPLPMGVEFIKYQGPGMVDFTRHESTPEPSNPYDETDRRFNFWQEPGPNEVEIDGPSGIARVVASFSEPGEYIIWIKVDVHDAPDSSDPDQCCWTNVYQRITVR